MKQRIISALIAIPLFLAIILFAPQSVYLAFWHLCIIACSYEFFKIRGLSKINSLITAAVVGSIAPVGFYLYINRFFHETYLLLFCSVMAYFVLYIWLIAVPILFRKYAKNQQFKSNNFYIFIIWLFIISYFYLFTAYFSGEEN
ncbi:MAG: phosphatidate cytidylyltransferase, partial [Neisseriaceae bacterium]|nr:phosphatidate cytidylyltransferase [Neisseriaceae bacterium]